VNVLSFGAINILDERTSDLDLTIIMPCLNEAETLASCISKAQSWSVSSGLNVEILIADNGSTDESRTIAIQLGARVVSVDERGYGAALTAGCRSALGRWIVMGDADDSYDFTSLNDFVSKLREGYDLVLGNRFLGGIKPGAMPWKNRYIGNPILSSVGRVLFSSNLGDFHCGLRAFTKAAFFRMDLRTSGMEFATEMVVKATMMKMKISEVPTTLSRDGRNRPPHLRPWRDGWRHLRFMLLMSPRWLFLAPGLGLVGFLGLVYLRIYLGPWDVAGATLDVRTLFFTQVGISLGIMLFLSGLISREIGVRDQLFRFSDVNERRIYQRLMTIRPLVGFCLMLLGFVTSLDAFVAWGDLGFNDIEGLQLLRKVSLATLFLSNGGIILTFSLLGSFISLPTRKISYSNELAASSREK
jgi:glycosyltransferase involved in cell wall biosynthesis